ncbi:MAG: helix-turn-helix transcriptional regulator [Acidobacteria bacterium]|nr:helix-turn-helix transcriptional regulator [Acidobacteriota bacterium]MBP7475099.1 helix-turn-helix transcriptional regulator [Pyrinomonadaceae bacterium]MBP9110160.1 helix-turn-helix transcriptional regulator [Pyrinomonadaceae bacterium]
MSKHQKMSPEAVNLVATRFKVLSEPLRLQILQYLENGESSVTNVTKAVNSTQPNVSKHLKILQDEGFVAKRQEGNTVFYKIADESIFELCDVVCGSLKERYSEKSAIFG